MPDRFETVMPWGKYGGKTVEEIPSGYLHWVANDSDADDELMEACQAELNFRSKWRTHFYENN